MRAEHKVFVESLRAKGWDVRLRSEPLEFPPEVLSRYAWVPRCVRDFVAWTDVVVCPEKTRWFVTAGELHGTGDSAFSWNAWESLSLDAAEGEPRWREDIRRFWDDHFTVFLSVKDGYEYVAVRRTDLAVVKGRGPEFEETDTISRDLEGFLPAIENDLNGSTR